MNVRERLFALQDTEFRKFQSRIMNNIPPESIIGVRVPQLKELAKELYTCPEKQAFLDELPHQYFEENHLHMLVICMEKDYDVCVEELERFLPYADNWSITDRPLPKSFTKRKQDILPLLKKWLMSEHVYTARFAIVMFMNGFLEKDFDAAYPELISRKRGEDYYLKMAVAWYFATALAKQYDAVLPFIEQGKLDTWTHNRAIQKAIESYRIKDEQKAYLRSLKKKAVSRE